MSEHGGGLLFDAMVYLGAAVVFVPLASRLKLGSVLGYLVAGCAIGPFGLGLVKDVESILHFSEFGVVMMLFLIGLELDPKRLWSMRRPVFGGGSLQLGACGVALGMAMLAFGLPWQAAVVAGLSLALSSTAIAVQSMKERGVLESPLGKSAFSILLFQDIAAIPLIAAVPLLAGGVAGGNGWIGAAKVFGAITAVVVLGRYVTTPLMRLVARTGLREIFTGFALLLIVGISYIMSFAGISMALGAFLAGVLLAGSEYRFALETDVEPFKGLLMGLFFIAVGMSIDFGLLASQPVLVALLVFGLVAVKTLVISALAPRLSVPAKDRWLFALMIAEGSEFAFVVFGVARQARLLPGNWDAILTLVVALSMALMPILLMIYAAIGKDERSKVKADAVESHGEPVIIAGFGRVGQIVGRMLFASNIRATVLDYDPDQIEFLKKFGFRVFFGDATRLDLMHAAGAMTAKLLVVTIDDVAASLHLVDLAKKHFPHLKLVVRARNVTHYLKLRERGVTVIERETFESALRIGREALEVLGTGRYEARERADRFRTHNIVNLEALIPFLADEAQRLSISKAAKTQLEEQFARDRETLDSVHSWTTTDVGEEREPAGGV